MTAADEMAAHAAGASVTLVQADDRNPWGVTDAEASVLDALCETGSLKKVAAELGLSYFCAQTRLRNAKLRMAGAPRSGPKARRAKPLPTLVACIRWARWTAAQR